MTDIAIPDDETRPGLSTGDILEMFLESQFWPPETLLAYQRSQLEQLLRHAKANVPFYETRLDCMFRADASIDWERWGEIPIVTRKDLRDQRDAMQARVLPPGHGKVFSISSSGSTGVPITVSFPEISMTVSSAAWQRMVLSHGLDAFKRVAEFKIGGAADDPTTTPPREVSAARSTLQRYYIDRRAPHDFKLAQLQSLHIEMVYDAPNNLEILARINLQRPQPVKLQAVVGIGMGFTPEQRELITASFGARVVSPYSSKEGSLIAAQCPSSQAFHVTAETLLFECLNENGEAVAAGQPGRSIITPFFYTAQPLIRYDQGDIVTLGSACSCGCTLPVLQNIVGRSDPIFRFPGRRFSITGIDYEALRHDLSAIAMQFAQVAATTLEIRYVAAQDASAYGIKAFVNRLQDFVGRDIVFTFRRVKDIPFNAGGKQQRMVREYEPGDDNA